MTLRFSLVLFRICQPYKIIFSEFKVFSWSESHLPSSSKIMKNTFYFEFFLFLRYLYFCADYLVMWKNGLIRNLSLISGFMASQNGQWVIARILPNVLGGGGSRMVLFGWGSQIILFGRLIERSIGNIFLEGAFSKYVGEAGSRLSYKCSV